MKPKYSWQIDSCLPLYLLYILFFFSNISKDHHRLAIWRWGKGKKNASDMKMKPFKWTSGSSEHPQAAWTPHAVSVDRLLRCGCGGACSENAPFHVNDGSLLHQQSQQKQFKMWASPLVSLKSLKSTPFLFFFFLQLSGSTVLWQGKHFVLRHTAALQDPTMHLSWLSYAAAPVWGGHGRSLGREAAATNRSSEEGEEEEKNNTTSMLKNRHVGILSVCVSVCVRVCVI